MQCALQLTQILNAYKIHKAHCIATLDKFINFFAKINVGTTFCLLFNVASMLISAVTFNITPNSEVLCVCHIIVIN